MKRVIALVIVISSLLTVLATSSLADTYFIICNPKSYVNVRSSPKKGAEEV